VENKRLGQSLVSAHPSLCSTEDYGFTIRLPTKGLVIQ